MSELDPEPWIHHERGGDYRGSLGGQRGCPYDCKPEFDPRPEFEQDESKYPHMQGVADTVKEDRK